MTREGRSQLYNYENTGEYPRQSSLPAPEIRNRGRIPPVYNVGNRSSRDLTNGPISSRPKDGELQTTTDYLETELAPPAEENKAYEATTDDSSVDQEGFVKISGAALAGWPHHSEVKCYANRDPNGLGHANRNRESQRRQN